MPKNSPRSALVAPVHINDRVRHEPFVHVPLYLGVYTVSHGLYFRQRVQYALRERLRLGGPWSDMCRLWLAQYALELLDLTL